MEQFAAQRQPSLAFDLGVTDDPLIIHYVPLRSKRRLRECDLRLGRSNRVVSLMTSTLHIATRLLPLKPTVVYNTYWRFAASRQDIYFNRIEGRPAPWTQDPILQQYKFTNPYRACDRVSQYLIRHVIYREDLPSTVPEVFFRIMLFKFFNKIETWEAIERELDGICYREYRFERYDEILSRLLAQGHSIYSAAYIMPSGGRSTQFRRKHQHHLWLLEQMMRDDVPARIAATTSMQQAFALLKSFPSVGDFLAYQYVTDINYSEITNFSESEFVVPGPGALDGIRKAFTDIGGLHPAEVIKFVADRQEDEFARLGLHFRQLWGRRLQLIDCQNLFCEVDKYARVRHPDIAGRSGRTRIKQKYAVTVDLPRPWFPPKWELNSRMAESFLNLRQPRDQQTLFQTLEQEG